MNDAILRCDGHGRNVAVPFERREDRLPQQVRIIVQIRIHHLPALRQQAAEFPSRRVGCIPPCRYKTAGVVTALNGPFLFIIRPVPGWPYDRYRQRIAIHEVAHRGIHCIAVSLRTGHLVLFQILGVLLRILGNEVASVACLDNLPQIELGVVGVIAPGFHADADTHHLERIDRRIVAAGVYLGHQGIHFVG